MEGELAGRCLMHLLPRGEQLCVLGMEFPSLRAGGQLSGLSSQAACPPVCPQHCHDCPRSPAPTAQLPLWPCLPSGSILILRHQGSPSLPRRGLGLGSTELSCLPGSGPEHADTDMRQVCAGALPPALPSGPPGRPHPGQMGAGGVWYASCLGLWETWPGSAQAPSQAHAGHSSVQL